MLSTGPSPSVSAPPRGSAMGSVSTMAPAPAPPRRPRWRTPAAGLEDGRLLEHGAQVERRAAGEVDEAGAGEPGSHAGVLGGGPVHHHEALDLRPEWLEPLGRPEHDPLGVLIGGRGRQDHHVGASRGRQQRGVEGAALGPFVAPDQGQRAGRVHGATLARPEPRLPDPPVAPASTPLVTRPVSLPPMSITRVGIVGSGIMGSGIAEMAAVNGFEVVLRCRSQSTAPTPPWPRWRSRSTAGREGQADRSRAGRDAGPGHRHLGSGRAQRRRPGDRVRRRGPGRQEGALQRARPDHQPDTILATNTSTLPVIELAMQTGRPDKVCGVHFFNPAPVMALVELVRPLTASDATIAGGHRRSPSLRQDPGRGQGPGRLHRQRPAVPVPEQRRPPLRAGRGHHGGHRRRHEGRLRLPDGTLRPARPGRPGHLAGHPRRPLRGVPRPQLRRRAAPAPHGRRRAARPEDRAGLLRLPEDSDAGPAGVG